MLQSLMLAQYTKLLDLTSATGGQPIGDLISDGTYLYGMTRNGGSSGKGTIFKIKPDGTGYIKLLDFLGTSNGEGPQGSLVFDGTFLYGMATWGGANNQGLIFKIKTDGTGYVNLHNFAGIPDGMHPTGTLITDNTFLYGMVGGGSNSCACGFVFKIKTDGSAYNTILSFNSTNGYGPAGALFYDGTFLYGMAEQGGTLGYGTIFKVKPDGSGYVNMYNFTNAPDGNAPKGSLVFDGTFFYAMTIAGGINSLGTIFKIKPDGSGYTNLYNFANAPDGNKPLGSLILDGGMLYGMAQYGGTSNAGTLFEIKTDGSGYQTLLNFNYLTGDNPTGSLISDGTFLYGMTSSGGNNGSGVVFKYNKSCTAATFTQSPILCPGQSIIVRGNTYSTTGTYTDVFPNGTTTGCDSTVITNLTVLPVNTFNWSPTMCQGQVVNVGSHTYTASGTYVDHLISQYGCDSMVITQLTILHSSSTTSNTITMCSSEPLIHVGADTYTTSGTYTYTYTYSGGGCDSTIITNLTINPSPTVSISGLAAICLGDNASTTLTATGNGSLLWSTGSTVDSIVVSPTIPTSYSVSVTLGSCKDSAATTVAINQPPIAGFLSGLSSCCNHAGFMDTSQTFMGDSIVAWNWTFAVGYPSTSNAQNPSVYLNQGYDTVCLIVTTLHGCKDTVCKTIYEPFASIEKFNNSSEISVYPNPTNGNLQIRIVGANNNLTEILVNDLLGKEVIKNIDIKTQNGIMQLDVSSLPAGIYFIKTNLGTQKFIKQ
jgi:uncharacterized repeat protein (TIGR03803 family)